MAVFEKRGVGFVSMQLHALMPELRLLNCSNCFASQENSLSTPLRNLELPDSKDTISRTILANEPLASPRWGTARKIIPRVEDIIALQSLLLFEYISLERSNALLMTMPPRLCAIKMRGRSTVRVLCRSRPRSESRLSAWEYNVSRVRCLEVVNLVLYPKLNIRAVGNAVGKRSRGHMTLLSAVQVLFLSPLSPWIKMMLVGA